MNRSIHKVQRGLWLLGSLVILALSLNVAYAASMKKQNLVDLMSDTDSILVGTVSEKTDGFYKGLPYTEITVKVGQTIRNNSVEHTLY